MNKMTKIAIPTDDGVIIRQKFRGSRAFAVATVTAGKIVQEELRWNLLSEVLTSGHGFFYNLCDCDVLIGKEAGSTHKQLMKSKNIIIEQTDETEITSAILHYVRCIPVLSEE
jgi:predicted Fe-Mo cluster-binding NifX family protein